MMGHFLPHLYLMLLQWCCSIFAQHRLAITLFRPCWPTKRFSLGRKQFLKNSILFLFLDPARPPFSLFSSFQQFPVKHFLYKILLMTLFELGASRIRRNHSANWVTTTAQYFDEVGPTSLKFFFNGLTFLNGQSLSICLRLVFSTVNNKIYVIYENCWWLDSNLGPVVSEATVLPTVQPPPPLAINT